MKVRVLVPSDDHLKQAGVRIRYRRIEHALKDQGHELRVTPIQHLAGQAAFADDVYLISKCHDARAFLAAHRAAESGKCVGVDLFDDYFSQAQDSRFTGLRYWLRTMLQWADFGLCSTPAMRDVVRGYAPELAMHVMNDPAVPPEPEKLRLAAARKLKHAHSSRTLSVGWFGIGDNPHFPVGLMDLVAFGGDLARLRGHGFDIRLDILTNQRAATADGLAMLARLAVPYAVEEWTEERERQLLDTCLVCFIPVNAQNFSVVKSMNRAVTALCAGAQVLSSGYPLYEPLAPFVYRDPVRLFDDLGRNTLLLREDTVPEMVRLMKQWADPVAEARSLIEFLKGRLERNSAAALKAPRRALAAVIHGKEASGDVHKFAQQMGALSVGSAFCTATLNFDVMFLLADDAAGLDVLIAEKHRPALGRDIQALLSRHGRILGTNYQKLNGSQLFPDTRFDGTALARMDSPISISASYPYLMASIEMIMRRLFPGVRSYHAEHAALPWSILPPAGGGIPG